MAVFGAADSAKREMAAYRNMVSHPGYQFALAQGLAGLALQERDLAARGVLYSADALYGTKVLRPEWMLLANSQMDYRAARGAYAQAREQAYHPTARLSVIRKYGFGGRR